jgi:mercuric ion transport protein
MKIEILYFDQCPSHGPTLERVKDLLRHDVLAADVVEVNVPDDATARQLHFLGSPTVRIDGLDIEPSARSSKAFGLMCRTYADGDRQLGIPPLDLIRTALRAAKKGPPVEPSSPKRRGLLLGASVAAAIGASLCCILPILAAVTGAGAIAAGVAFERWRPYLLGLTALLLVGGVLLTWRDKKACAVGSLCSTKPMSRWNYVALAMLAAGVVALAAFPYYSGAVARMVVGQSRPTQSLSSTTLSTITFRVPDMDCPACAVALSAALDKLPGVADAKLDVSSRRAVVTYDPGTQDVEALEKVISDAGFHIALEPGSS